MLQIRERSLSVALEIEAETRMIILRINYLDGLEALHKNNRKMREYRSCISISAAPMQGDSRAPHRRGLPPVVPRLRLIGKHLVKSIRLLD